MKDPREDIYVSAPFASISWSEGQGWNIQSSGCGCCSSIDEHVTLDYMLIVRKSLIKTIADLDKIIEAKRTEDQAISDLKIRLTGE